MKIQLRPSLLKVRRQTVKWIIIHHTSEIYPQPAAKIDNSTFQTGELYKGVLEDKSGDVNYHYIVEKIKDDYQVLTGRPFVYLCDWDSIPVNINNRSIHVALLGDYSLKIPEMRLYDVLAYRLLNPFMKMYALSPSRIKFHSEVSTVETDCPGDFVDKEVIISKVRRFVIK